MDRLQELRNSAASQIREQEEKLRRANADNNPVAVGRAYADLLEMKRLAYTSFYNTPRK